MYIFNNILPLMSVLKPSDITFTSPVMDWDCRSYHFHLIKPDDHKKKKKTILALDIFLCVQTQLLRIKYSLFFVFLAVEINLGLFWRIFHSSHTHICTVHLF